LSNQFYLSDGTIFKKQYRTIFHYNYGCPFRKAEDTLFQDLPLLSVVNILLYYSVRNA